MRGGFIILKNLFFAINNAHPVRAYSDGHRAQCTAAATRTFLVNRHVFLDHALHALRAFLLRKRILETNPVFWGEKTSRCSAFHTVVVQTAALGPLDDGHIALAVTAPFPFK